MAADSILAPSPIVPQVQPFPGRLKRVLFVLNLHAAGKFGSMEEQTLSLARSFRERDSLFLPVFVRPLDADSTAQYTRDGLEVEALDLTRFRLGTFRRLLELIGRHRIEVVHWNFYHPIFNGYLWALSALRPGIDHYFTDHISRSGRGQEARDSGRLKSFVKRALSSRYRRIFCISDFVVAQMQALAGPRAERVHYFVNTDRFRPDASVRSEVRLAQGVGEEFVVVTVAYLIKEKGIDVVIRAMSELSSDAVLWVVGQGPEQANLQALAQERGLGERVRFLGPKRNVEPFMQAADCFVCPSIWAEAVGLVNLEALACGLPVIASRIGGLPEMIVEKRTGFLFTSGDSAELAGHLKNLMSDVQRRRRMGLEARADAIERFSTQSQIENQVNFYRE
jgi:glycosyltransferase involved in cell wall biosynthesis